MSKLSNNYLHYLSQYFKTSGICISLRRTKRCGHRTRSTILSTLQIAWMSLKNKWSVKFIHIFFFYSLCAAIYVHVIFLRKKATVIELSNLWPSAWRVSCDTATRSYFLLAAFPIGDSIIQEGRTKKKKKKTRNKSWPKLYTIARMLEKRISSFSPY